MSRTDTADAWLTDEAREALRACYALLLRIRRRYESELRTAEDKSAASGTEVVDGANQLATH